ncbi:TetR family transcriptional regulator [Rhodococcus sp. 7Tela_A2]|jgi:TetR/AcrR family transcriptional regulator, cholesterol catabolism regulator|uniref:TetR family transcriptional regulator n=1 Tax=Rhodococcus sp. 7Tela_A2 TaxID=3093744 RepID=UPI003BB56C93
MPRIAKAREGAEPTSDVQRERQVRILTAAARLGSEHELTRVQMAEVAKDAGVAIGTLYRYFPSKTHLFVALLLSQLERAKQRLPDPPPGVAPPQAICDALVVMTRAIVARPRLASAMLVSNSTASASVVPDSVEVERVFQGIVLAQGGIEQPTDTDRDAVRLLSMVWFGLILVLLNGRVSIEETETDIRRACDLLLVHMADTAPGPV